MLRPAPLALHISVQVHKLYCTSCYLLMSSVAFHERVMNVRQVGTLHLIWPENERHSGIVTDLQSTNEGAATRHEFYKSTVEYKGNVGVMNGRRIDERYPWCMMRKYNNYQESRHGQGFRPNTGKPSEHSPGLSSEMSRSPRSRSSCAAYQA